MLLKVFVTGGTGFLGRYLLEALVHDPRVGQIIALCRQPTVNSVESYKIQWVRGNLRNLDPLIPQIKDVHYVFHLGANARFGAGSDYGEDNTGPVEKLVKVFTHQPQFKNLIFVSSVGAFDRSPEDSKFLPLTNKHVASPRSDYGRSKWNAEKILVSHGVPYTIVRPTWIYGRGMRIDSHLRVLGQMALAKSPVTRLNWPGSVGVVHAEDLAKQLTACLENPKVINQRYFVSSETVGFAQIFSQFHGLKTLKLPWPNFIFRKFHAWMPQSLAMLVLPYLVVDAKPWIEATQAPQIFFDTGVKELIAEIQGQGSFFVITGANSGIGFELAKLWKDRALLLVDKNVARLRSEFPLATVIECDLSDPMARKKLIERLRSCSLKVFVNNAGVGTKGSTHEVSRTQLQLMVAVNFEAPIDLIQSLAAQLQTQGTTIVNVTSSVAFNALPGMSIYAATKAALQSWSESLAVEWKATNTVITMAPSGTRTGFQGAAGVRAEASQKLLSPEQVARTIAMAVSGGRTQIIQPGGASRILLLISGFLPRGFRAPLWGKLFQKSR